jgi:hypothetical protein
VPGEKEEEKEEKDLRLFAADPPLSISAAAETAAAATGAVARRVHINMFRIN